MSEQLQSYLDMKQGIIDPKGTETFAKEHKFAKYGGSYIRRPTVSLKKFTGSL